jgi:hypothetical protein
MRPRRLRNQVTQRNSIIEIVPQKNNKRYASGKKKKNVIGKGENS